MKLEGKDQKTLLRDRFKKALNCSLCTMEIFIWKHRGKKTKNMAGLRKLLAIFLNVKKVANLGNHT